MSTIGQQTCHEIRRTRTGTLVGLLGAALLATLLPLGPAIADEEVSDDQLHGYRLSYLPDTGSGLDGFDLEVFGLTTGVPAPGLVIDLEVRELIGRQVDPDTDRLLGAASVTLGPGGRAFIELDAAPISTAELVYMLMRMYPDQDRTIQVGTGFDLFFPGVARRTSLPYLTDVFGTTHSDSIFDLVRRRVTTGFADNTFRPTDPVERGQAATFLAFSGFPAPHDQQPRSFTDIAGTTHEETILNVARNGWVGGFSDGTFRPREPITRGQMASIIARAAQLPPAADQGLSDVPGTTHEDAINRLVAAGIAGGFSDGTFRPGLPVERGQLATFIVRAQDLLGVVE